LLTARRCYAIRRPRRRSGIRRPAVPEPSRLRGGGRRLALQATPAGKDSEKNTPPEVSRPRPAEGSPDDEVESEDGDTGDGQEDDESASTPLFLVHLPEDRAEMAGEAQKGDAREEGEHPEKRSEPGRLGRRRFRSGLPASLFAPAAEVHDLRQGSSFFTHARHRTDISWPERSDYIKVPATLCHSPNERP
jgi:hypothetical protein